MKPEPDIVERLRLAPDADFYKPSKWFELMNEAAAEIEQLREEAETWRDAFEAERQDHEATMKAWDAERSGQ